MRWIWALYLCQCAPYLLMFLRCTWKMCFKNKNSPPAKTLVVVSLMKSRADKC